ncbi:xanthine dehydrogenase accessory factor [Paenibacillus endophyticus]|uniref:Xanthine dehydrogenase accessory factor n=1 Tax=Paenibacillus endophyticus TaxID=1294268 RepID=A0A7W5C741_9BACL|nr:XdhC family protein [Paenibacillus endophyticus]MBB3151965.1 xanthine dehydrogenase accessory factor [Paenibacillus endophyticus]
MDMHEILEALHLQDESQCVLATILCVEGHSYRKAGASMLFKPNGKQIGAVSPGCLEHDLQEIADVVRTSGQFSLISYNMNADEDAIWGDAIGCGGEIRLLLEPVHGQLLKLLLVAREKLEAGITVRLMRSWDDAGIDYVLHDLANVETDAVYWEEVDERYHLFVDITPRQRLVIFGVGKDAEAIYALVKQIGFQVIVVDWRPALCTQERFPEAAIITGSPEAIAEQLQFRSSDYLIVCSHHLQRDREMIRVALPLQLVYIGILGSKKRIRMLFETFLIPSNVRAPIGLAIGADGPYEIAVSVAAELIAIRAGRKERLRKERRQDEYYSPLFGSRTEQANGH